LVPERDRGDVRAFGGGKVATWRGLVYTPLDEGTGNVGDRGEEETDTQSSHGSQRPSDSSHEWVKTKVENGSGDNNCKSVEVWTLVS
jgi:hypothetical protein